MEPDPGIFGAGNGNLDFRILLHILVDILGAVGAEPQFAVKLAGKHEGAALGLA